MYLTTPVISESYYLMNAIQISSLSRDMIEPQTSSVIPTLHERWTRL